MSGDHDSELILPNVQETFEQRLGAGLLNPAIRWLVQEEAFRVKVGNAIVVVEHGHSLDPWNRIDYGSLQKVLSLCSRNLPGVSDCTQPLGRKLTTTVIRELRSRYHWIDCLKPASELVLPLLWWVAESNGQQETISERAEEHLSNKEFAITKKLSNSHDPTTLYRGQKEAEQLLHDQVFERWNRAIHAKPEDANDNGYVNDTLLQDTRLLSGHDTLFDLYEPDDSTKYLAPIFKGGADLVIHGHTHAAKALSLENGVYINTGTWTQLLFVPKSFEPDGVWRQFLDRLRTNESKTFCRPTFAHVQHQPRKNVTTAALLEWQHSSPQILTTNGVGSR